MAFPTVVAVGAPNSGAAAVTYTLPTHQADDILLLFVECAESAGATAPSGGWAHVTNSPNPRGSNVTCVNLLWLRATGSGTTNPQVADPGNHQVGFVMVVRGCETTGNPWDGTPTQDSAAGSTQIIATGVDTTVDETLVVYAVAGNTDTTTDQWSSIANADLANVTVHEQEWTTSGNGGGIMAVTGEKATAGPPGTMTASMATMTWASISLALKPPAGGGPLSVDADPGALTLSGVDVTAAGSGAASVAADVAAVALTGVEVAAQGTGAVSVAVDPAVLSLSGMDIEAATGGIEVAVDPATLTLTGQDVTAAGTGVASVTLDTAALTLTGQTPTAAGTGATSTAIDPAVLTITGQTPTAAGTGVASVAVDVAVLLLSGVDVSTVATIEVAVDPATLTLTGVDLSAAGTGSAPVAIDAAALTVVGLTPTAAGSGSTAVVADSATLLLTGVDPTAAGSGAASVSVDSALLVLEGVEVIASGFVADTNPITVTVRALGTKATAQAESTRAASTPDTKATARAESTRATARPSVTATVLENA